MPEPSSLGSGMGQVGADTGPAGRGSSGGNFEGGPVTGVAADFGTGPGGVSTAQDIFGSGGAAGESGQYSSIPGIGLIATLVGVLESSFGFKDTPVMREVLQGAMRDNAQFRQIQEQIKMDVNAQLAREGIPRGSLNPDHQQRGRDLYNRAYTREYGNYLERSGLAAHPGTFFAPGGIPPGGFTGTFSLRDLLPATGYPDMSGISGFGRPLVGVPDSRNRLTDTRPYPGHPGMDLAGGVRLDEPLEIRDQYSLAEAGRRRQEMRTVQSLAASIFSDPGRAQNLMEGITTGRGLGPDQREFISLLTPAQRLAAGIIVDREGRVVPSSRVLAAALERLSNGTPLTSRQNVLFGQIYRNLNTEQRRDLVAAIGRESGLGAGVSRRRFAPALDTAVRAAIAVNRQARAETKQTTFRVDRKRILDLVGRQPFTTVGGRSVSAVKVVGNALRNATAGRPLTKNQEAVLKQARLATGWGIGSKEHRARVAAVVRRQVVKKPLVKGQKAKQLVAAVAASPWGGSRAVLAKAQKATTQATKRAQQVERQKAGYNVQAAPPGPAKRAAIKTAKQVVAKQKAVLVKQAKGQASAYQVVKAAAAKPAIKKQAQKVLGTGWAAPKIAVKPAAKKAAPAWSAPKAVSKPAAKKAAPAKAVVKPAAKKAAATWNPPVKKKAPAPVYVTKTGKLKTTKEVLAAAAKYKKLGKPLKPNMKKALKAQKKK